MNNNLKNQSGVTLLISILVMSGLALISLAVGTFAIQELRASRADIVSEPAIAAAETAGEQGLWAIKRNTTLINCNSGQTAANLSNGAVVNSCKSYGSATINLKANTPLAIFLYDPNNINGDIDLLGYPYNNLTVVHQSGQFQVNINVVRLDGTPVGAQPLSVSPGGTGVVNIPAVGSTNPQTEGRMQVTLQSTGDATIVVNTNQGMPTYPTIKAGGCAARTSITNCSTAGRELYSRSIEITVPQ